MQITKPKAGVVAVTRYATSVALAFSDYDSLDSEPAQFNGDREPRGARADNEDICAGLWERGHSVSPVSTAGVAEVNSARRETTSAAQ
jgi:hypothetical protein